MSLPPAAHVYTGPWINWSKGVTLGSTATLTQRSGSLLTAFLGIYVTFAGAACWRILSFLWHQHRSTKGLKTPLHHQQQVILRNSTTSGSAAWQMTQAAWRWRRISKSNPKNVLLILFAICHMLLFALAGVFSADFIKAARNVVLVRSPNCGYTLSRTGDEDIPSTQQIVGPNAKDANDTHAASAYSRACYDEENAGPQCNQYPISRLPWMTRANVSCPFSGNICKDGVGGFEMDTGFLNSHKSFGINSKPSDQVEYRKKATCSVLRTKEYSEYFNWTNPDNENDVEELVGYKYGLILDQQNYTHQYNKNDFIGMTGYTFTPYMFIVNSKPIDELKRSDAEVTLNFLASNAITYKSPVQDPLFKATIREEFKDYDGKVAPEYTSDYWMGVLACADQFQFRNPANEKSTLLTTSSLVIDDISLLQFNKVQEQIALSFYTTAPPSTIYYSVHSRGGSSLRASDTVGADLSQIGLPDNQWQLEATELFSVSMAKVQQQVFAYATGPRYFHEGLDFVKGHKDLCQRQTIRNVSGYLSFSILGVSIILILGFLLILTALVIDHISGFIRQKLNQNDHKRLQWAVDDKLQLQRLAFEEAGQGEWTGGTDSVPMTSANQLVGLGSNPDRYHPRFASNDSESTSSVSKTDEMGTRAMLAVGEPDKEPQITNQEIGWLPSR